MLLLLYLYSVPAMYQTAPWLSIVERSPDDCYFPNDNEESLGKLFGFAMNLISTCLPMLPSSPNQIRVKVNLKDNGEYYVIIIISTLLNCSLNEKHQAADNDCQRGDDLEDTRYGAGPPLQSLQVPGVHIGHFDTEEVVNLCQDAGCTRLAPSSA